jgi:hypothetical protein
VHETLVDSPVILEAAVIARCFRIDVLSVLADGPVDYAIRRAAAEAVMAEERRQAKSNG